MDFDQIVNEVQTRAADLSELNHTVLFDMEDAGKILLDATGDGVVITPNPDDDEAETTLVLSPENLQKLMVGDLNPMVAFTMGKLKVSAGFYIQLHYMESLGSSSRQSDLLRYTHLGTPLQRKYWLSFTGLVMLIVHLNHFFPFLCNIKRSFKITGGDIRNN